MEKMKQETINQIKKMNEEGKKIIQIAKELGISKNTVYYYLDDSFRSKVLKSNTNWFKNLPKERRSFYYQKRKEYLKNYMKNKYQTNEVFRNKQKEKSKKQNESNNIS